MQNDLRQEAPLIFPLFSKAVPNCACLQSWEQHIYYYNKFLKYHIYYTSQESAKTIQPNYNGSLGLWIRAQMHQKRYLQGLLFREKYEITKIGKMPSSQFHHTMRWFLHGPSPQCIIFQKSNSCQGRQKIASGTLCSNTQIREMLKIKMFKQPSWIDQDSTKKKIDNTLFC